MESHSHAAQNVFISLSALFIKEVRLELNMGNLTTNCSALLSGASFLLCCIYSGYVGLYDQKEC